VIKIIIKSLIPEFFLRMLLHFKHLKILKKWESDGRPLPPPHLVKQKLITSYQWIYNYKVFVETGTFLGEMVEAQKHNFKKIYSIELSSELYKKAKLRFQRNSNIKLFLGDSGEILKDVLLNINEPAIFWLDGHYSEGNTAKGKKECPIFEELDNIFNSDSKHKHILLIGDARLFNGEGDYPTLEKVREYIRKKNNNYNIIVNLDVIQCIL